VILHARPPSTAGLMGAIPTLEQTSDRLVQIPGAMPRLNAIPTGCAFNPRCAHVFDRCRAERPVLQQAAPNHDVACWLTQEGSA